MTTVTKKKQLIFVQSQFFFWMEVGSLVPVGESETEDDESESEEGYDKVEEEKAITHCNFLV